MADRDSKPTHAMTDRLGRLLMAGIFVHGGWNTFREPGGRAQKAAKLGLPQPEKLTRLSGLGMMVAAQQLIHFLKNAGLLGGLLILLSKKR